MKIKTLDYTPGSWEPIMKKWSNWFLGFVDAEGNFQTYPKKRLLKSGEVSKYNIGLGFHISLHLRDLSLIKTIHSKLNVGIISVNEKKNDARLAVNDKAGILEICKFFENYTLLTSHQLTRFLLLKEFLIRDVKEFKSLDLYNKYKEELELSIMNNINIPDIKTLLNDEYIDYWIVGFINGEGCFYLRNEKCNFIIEHTDKLALELIKARLNFGPKVSERSLRTKDTGGFRKLSYQLTISSKKDIKTLVDFLDSCSIPLQGYKYNQYIEWKSKLN